MSKLSEGFKLMLNSTDSWTGHDKLLHLGAGVFTSVAVSLITGNIILGFAAGAVVALGKEVYDMYNIETNTPSIKDFVVTVLGAAVGAIGTQVVINSLQ